MLRHFCFFLVQIPSEPLKKPLSLANIQNSLSQPHVDEKVPKEGNLRIRYKKGATNLFLQVEQSIIKQICEMFENASKPIILVDACAIRYGVQDLTQDLIEKTGIVRPLCLIRQGS